MSDDPNAHPLLRGATIDNPIAAKVASHFDELWRRGAGLERDNYSVLPWLQGQLDSAHGTLSSLLLLTHELGLTGASSLDETIELSCQLLRELGKYE